MDKEELNELRAKISSIKGVSNHKDKIYDAIEKLGLKLRKTNCGSCLLDYRQIILDEIDSLLE